MRVLGVGFRAAADLASLQEALQLALTASDGAALQAVVTEAAKSREALFQEFAQVLRLPGLGIRQDELAQMVTPTQSARIQDRFGTGSLAEAAALAAAGPNAQLIVSRVVSGNGMATAAIAES